MLLLLDGLNRIRESGVRTCMHCLRHHPTASLFRLRLQHSLLHAHAISLRWARIKALYSISNFRHTLIMDPLSATASIIALTQAVVGISKGVRFLRSLRQIPLEFSDLLNEFSTLQAVTEQVEAALREWETLRSTTTYATSFRIVDPSKVLSLKDNLNQVINEFNDLCNRLKAPRKQKEKQVSDEESSVSKLRWQKEKDNIARLRQKARHTRELLSLCFSAFNSAQAQHHAKITLDIQEVLITATQSILQLQNENTERERGSQAILTHLQQSMDQMRRDFPDRNSPTSIEGATTEVNSHVVKNDTAANTQWSTSESMVQFQAVLFRTCSSTCSCSCHQMKRSRSPHWLASLMGNLFLYYNVNPIFQRPTCDRLSCTVKSPSSVRLYYTFPRWLLARSIDWHASWSSLTGQGSSLHIRVPRVLESHSHRIFKAIEYGDFRFVRLQLANKSVLPTDVDEGGQSLALVAICWRQFELAKFFAQQGCDIHSKDELGLSAASVALQLTFINLYTDSSFNMESNIVKKIVKEFSLQQQILENLPSSEIHQAILHDKDELVTIIIKAGSAELNQVDGFGCTPLHWAIFRQNTHVIRALLEAGAAPDIPSSSGQTPLSLAADMKDVCSRTRKIIASTLELRCTHSKRNPRRSNNSFRLCSYNMA
ncbi:hypothetical protein F4777DRAFT_384368 [Nemania sp. FL0916]|nr:hypothetical protein F4777DRAFT_384368 [Nemania sp. FL0916]